MWLVFPDCFVSVVVHQDQPSRLVVRARLRDDIERLLPGAEVVKNPEADYLYRTTVQREVLAEAVLRRLGSMTYTNVKGAVALNEKTRSYMMSRMWSAGLDAQREEERGTRIVDYNFGEDDEDEPVAGHFQRPVFQADLFEGRKRRERGMVQAVSNTDPEWRRSVLSLCDAFISRPAAARRLFTAEDLREWCENAVGQPHHHNAWSANLGGVIRSWKSRGLIEQVGSQEARRPAAHARLMRCYRVTSPMVHA